MTSMTSMSPSPGPGATYGQTRYHSNHTRPAVQPIGGYNSPPSPDQSVPQIRRHSGGNAAYPGMGPNLSPGYQTLGFPVDNNYPMLPNPGTHGEGYARSSHQPTQAPSYRPVQQVTPPHTPFNNSFPGQHAAPSGNGQTAWHPFQAPGASRGRSSTPHQYYDSPPHGHSSQGN